MDEYDPDRKNKVSIEELKKMSIAQIRHQNPYHIPKTITKNKDFSLLDKEQRVAVITLIRERGNASEQTPAKIYHTKNQTMKRRLDSIKKKREKQEKENEADLKASEKRIQSMSLKPLSHEELKEKLKDPPKGFISTPKRQKSQRLSPPLPSVVELIKENPEFSIQQMKEYYINAEKKDRLNAKTIEKVYTALAEIKKMEEKSKAPTSWPSAPTGFSKKRGGRKRKTRRK